MAEPIFLELVDQRRAADPEGARGRGLIAAMVGERSRDHAALEALDLLAQVQAVVGVRRVVGHGADAAEHAIAVVREGQRTRDRERSESSDGVLELANVAGPIFADQRADQLGLERELAEPKLLAVAA